MTYLETSLDRAAEAKPNPGRTEALHRLNRAEYRNVIRDLLALDIDVAAMLPADDVSYGFDNIAGVQRMSPTLMERYLSAARKISSVAVGATPSIPTTETYTFRPSFGRTIAWTACRSAHGVARCCATHSHETASTAFACS